MALLVRNLNAVSECTKLRFCKFPTLCFFIDLDQVTMNDGYKYAVTRRYSQFDELRVRVLPVLRVVTPSFPPKHGVRSAVVGLGPDGIEERRCVNESLQRWFISPPADTGVPWLICATISSNRLLFCFVLFCLSSCDRGSTKSPWRSVL